MELDGRISLLDNHYHLNETTFEGEQVRSITIQEENNIHASIFILIVKPTFIISSFRA